MHKAILLVLLFTLSTQIGLVEQFEELDEQVIAKSQGVHHELIFMGNSYTQGNSLTSYIDAIFASGQSNHNARVQELSGGGMRLDQHADDAEQNGHHWQKTLNQTNPVDYVILQDQSQVPSFPVTSPYWQNSKDGAVRLDSIIEDSQGTVIFFMTWGYRDGDSQNSWRNPDYLTMQANLKSGYEMYAENITTPERKPYIAPVGLAFKHIYDSIVADGGTPEDPGTTFYNLYQSDASHPSRSGTYIAQCVFHSTILGRPCAGLGHNPYNFDQALLLELQEAADEAVFNQSGYDYPWSDNPPPVYESNMSVSSLSNQTVLPGQEVEIDFTIRNDGSYDDSLELNLASPSQWNYRFDGYDSVSDGSVKIPVSTQSSLDVKLIVEVPYLWQGSPQAGEVADFVLEGITDIDATFLTRSFSLTVGEVQDADLLGLNSTLIVSPRQSSFLELEYKNTGNSIANFSTILLQANEDGTPIQGQQYSPNLVVGEWQFGISSWQSEPAIEGIQALNLTYTTPNVASGEFYLLIQVLSTDSQVVFDSQLIKFQIKSNEEFEVTWLNDCLLIEEKDGIAECSSILHLHNKGDMAQTYNINTYSFATFLDVSTEFDEITLEANESTILEISLSTDQHSIKGGLEPTYGVEILNDGNVEYYSNRSLRISKYGNFSFELYDVDIQDDVVVVTYLAQSFYNYRSQVIYNFGKFDTNMTLHDSRNPDSILEPYVTRAVSYSPGQSRFVYLTIEIPEQTNEVQYINSTAVLTNEDVDYEMSYSFTVEAIEQDPESQEPTENSQQSKFLNTTQMALITIIILALCATILLRRK